MKDEFPIRDHAGLEDERREWNERAKREDRIWQAIIWLTGASGLSIIAYTLWAGW